MLEGSDQIENINNNEGSNIKEEREVQLGEFFTPFIPKYTEIDKRPNAEEYRGVNGYYTKIKLKGEDDNILTPVEFAVFPTWKSNSQAFTPFSPEEGYRVDEQDFLGESRMTKVEKMGIPKWKVLNNSPLQLNVSTGGLDISSFLLQISFPNGYAFEARPIRNEFEQSFYPLDSGPLVVPDSYKGQDIYYEGLMIALPDNLNLLSQMKAKFLGMTPR